MSCNEADTARRQLVRARWQQAAGSAHQQNGPNLSEVTSFTYVTESGSQASSASASQHQCSSSLKRFCVLVKEARGLPLRNGGAKATQKLYVKVKVAGRSKQTVLVEAGCHPIWRELLNFSLPTDHASAHVTLRVKRMGTMFTRLSELLGQVKFPIAAVEAAPNEWAQPRTLHLCDRLGKPVPGAELVVQVFSAFSQGIDGPLSVMCATWNVGNTLPPPPADLQYWLKGCARGEHHLVAVAAQECNYSVKKSTGNTSLDERRGASDAGGSSLGDDGICMGIPGTFDPDILATAAAAAGALAGLDQQHSSASLPPMLSKDSSQSNWSFRPPSGPMSSSSAAAAATGDRGGLQGKDTGIGVLDQREDSSGTTGRVTAVTGVGEAGEEDVVSKKKKKKARRVKQVILQTVDSAAHWEEHISQTVGHSYCLVGSKHMFQTRLLVFARVDVFPLVNGVTAGFEATGVGGVGVNKGGLAIGLRVGSTELCFVGCHLAAHQSKLKQRNNDCAEIIRNLHVARGPVEDIVTGFHHVFWMGDLNYRLNYGSQALTQADSPTPDDFDRLIWDIKAGRYQQLLAVDQLKEEISQGRVLTGFSEGDINFAPTFKVEKGKGGLAYNQKRSPAYCDRVLVRSNMAHKPALPIEYWSVPAILASDHKPVGASFKVPIAAQPQDNQRHTRSSSSNSGYVKLRILGIEAADVATWDSLCRPVWSAKALKIKPQMHLMFCGPALGAPRKQVASILGMKAPPSYHSQTSLATLQVPSPHHSERQQQTASGGTSSTQPLQKGHNDAQQQQQQGQSTRSGMLRAMKRILGKGTRGSDVGAAAASGAGGGGGGGAGHSLINKPLLLELNTKGGTLALMDERLLCCLCLIPEGQLRSKVVARGLVPLHQVMSDAQTGLAVDAGPSTSQLVVPMEVEGTVRGALLMQVQLLSSWRALRVAKQAVHAMHMLSSSRASRSSEGAVALEAPVDGASLCEVGMQARWQ